MTTLLVTEIDDHRALNFGRVNRLSESGSESWPVLATPLTALPQSCLRNDRCSTYEPWNLNATDALSSAYRLGLSMRVSAETETSASRFNALAAHRGQLTSSPI